MSKIITVKALQAYK